MGGKLIAVPPANTPYVPPLEFLVNSEIKIYSEKESQIFKSNPQSFFGIN